MKLKDALHIAAQNLRTHLKRNVMVILTMGVIFGLIFTIQFLKQGLENAYSKSANMATNGKVIIVATNDSASLGVTKPIESGLYSIKDIASDIERYGGKIISLRSADEAYNITLDPQLVEGAIIADLSSAPSGTTPILANAVLWQTFLDGDIPGKELSMSYIEYRQQLIGQTFSTTDEKKYFVAGLAPGGFGIFNLSFKQLDYKNKNILNPLLELLTVPSGYSITIGNTKPPQKADFDYFDVSPAVITAVFDNVKQAYDYFKNGESYFKNVELPNRKYLAETVAGMSPEAYYGFQIFDLVAGVACILLGAIAIIIVIFTTIRLVDQDKNNIALYYSLGATTKQVGAIYLGYFSMLMLGATILALILASIVTLAYSLCSQEMLSEIFMLAFSLPESPFVLLCGINIEVVIFILLMLVMAPVCVLLNRKYIAKASSYHPR